ncbi:MAG TPA: hypothetical protein VK168_18095 [Saprospiraceae bacterium]|nr:hypothetical protein [Saprospiraceae bacterium]
MSQKCWIYSCLFLSACFHPPENKPGLEVQIVSLKAYAHWPASMCGQVVDDSLLYSMERSGLIALQYTNHGYKQVNIQLGGPICDSLLVVQPDIKVVYNFQDNQYVENSTEIICSFGRNEVQLPKDSSVVLLFDAKADLEQFPKHVIRDSSMKLDSAGVTIYKSLTITRTEKEITCLIDQNR